MRGARAAGASWSQTGAAPGTGKQAAREAHPRWIDAQEAARDRPGEIGLDAAEVAEARAVAGAPDSH
ncbi:hypothetical protein ACIGW1_14505 [Streptomyces sp. NPDC053780]|uniref:hypothetical protein n=1 Tax=unclassified Streptomyces TaxID=2593676 RepID=UPI003440BFA8